MSLEFPQHLASGGSRPRPGPDERTKPGPGQLSVWEPPFTRPPTVRSVHGRHVIMRAGAEGPIIVDSKRGVQVCETSHPPTWYFPKEDVNMELVTRRSGATDCEFKGSASYFDVLLSQGGGERIPQSAWSYEHASGTNALIAGHIAFYLKPPLVATVDGEKVTPQEGDFYGGWITPDIVGPFKGGQAPGSGDSELNSAESLIARAGGAAAPKLKAVR
eukprot:CAMPEP_0119418874 /NCGR_PEP_ID=MMETSP1335-20130426/19339_1 /TAXON_ID=259385 /ORGANISM="Chrysoculter rhomboideus, Strain RCC1486" /LENGTH=216 /DNA_ID=CAMNT_0007444145 /DNA_START=32 /DNA_END=679 /DNA_ORIENTATION=-